MRFESEFVISHSRIRVEVVAVVFKACRQQWDLYIVKRGDSSDVNNYRPFSLLLVSFKFFRNVNSILFKVTIRGPLYLYIMFSERSERGVRAGRCGRLFTASSVDWFEIMTISRAVPCRGDAPRTVGSGWFRGRSHQDSDWVGVPLLRHC